MGELLFFKIKRDLLKKDSVSSTGLNENNKKNYIRYLYNSTAFYSNSEYFSEPYLCNKKTEPNYVYFVTHEFDDGSYWIHWLMDEYGAVLESKNITTASMNSNKYPVFHACGLLISIILLILGFLGVINLLFFIFIILLSLFLGGSWVSSHHQYKAINYEGIDTLINWSKKHEEIDTSIFIPIEKIQKSTNSVDYYSKELINPIFSIFSGQVNILERNILRIPGRTGSKTFKYINFSLNNNLFQLKWAQHGEILSANPILWDRHPPFIADGDEVYVYYCDKYDKNRNEINTLISGVSAYGIDGREDAVYLYNKTDNSIYGSIHSSGTKKNDGELFKNTDYNYIEYLT